MKFHLKALIAGMVLCLAGTVGAAFAIDAKKATGTGGSGIYDKAINLCWVDGEQSITLNNMEHMKTNVAEYRYLSVVPNSTKTLTGTVTLSFEMEVTDDTLYHLDGVKVKVYQTSELATDETVAALIAAAGDPEVSLDKDNLTGSTDFTISASGDSSSHKTPHYYAIEVKYDGTVVASKTMSGELTISQSFAA